MIGRTAGEQLSVGTGTPSLLFNSSSVLPVRDKSSTATTPTMSSFYTPTTIFTSSSSSTNAVESSPNTPAISPQSATRWSVIGAVLGTLLGVLALLALILLYLRYRQRKRDGAPSGSIFDKEKWIFSPSPRYNFGEKSHTRVSHPSELDDISLAPSDSVSQLWRKGSLSEKHRPLRPSTDLTVISEKVEGNNVGAGDAGEAYLSSEPSTTFRHFTTHLLCDRQYRNFYIALISFSETVGIHSVALKVRTHSRNIEGCEHIPFSTWASWLFSHSPTRFFRNGFNHVSESASLRWPPAEALAYIAGALMYAERCPEFLAPGYFDCFVRAPLQ
ncbi:hypothetical protein Moror_2466 [Moniliophthora roreri MCA 2997]|uniref:Uncharacterized protein n=1 Tax=Moniliophthora roreri (strain MCA 2997) TaxID=1381753 RepID=V2WW05_MONRO|nr:hypothetical protein Moror_2466 [Moniliophthora roreri MCA 2997]